MAAALATLVLAALTGIGVRSARVLEDAYVRALAPIQLEAKNRISALQETALRQPDLLVLYGSSELTTPSPFHASEIFRRYPTGFTVFPVGEGGTTSLTMLQSVAAAGSALRGKRVAVSLSPTWFYDRAMAPPAFYAGTFSRLGAYALVFSPALRLETQQAAARRMLQYPETFANDRVLTLALASLADDRLLSHLLYDALWPLGKLEELVLRMQDHWETLRLIYDERGLKRRVPRVPAPLDWSALLAAAKHEEDEDAATRSRPRRGGFSISRLQESAEWTDLELLLEALRAFGARPLILSMPIAGAFYDTHGVSHEARQEFYYDRLRQLAERFGVSVVDFLDQDEDPGFLDGVGAHLSPKGWVYYARALDRFYHGAVSSEGPTPTGRPATPPR